MGGSHKSGVSQKCRRWGLRISRCKKGFLAETLLRVTELDCFPLEERHANLHSRVSGAFSVCIFRAFLLSSIINVLDLRNLFIDNPINIAQNRCSRKVLWEMLT